MRKYFSLYFSFIVLVLGICISTASAKSNPIDAKVIHIFEVSYEGECDTLDPTSNSGSPEPTIFQLSFNYGNEDSPPRLFRLYEFPCYRGAYNLSSVYYGASEYDEVQQIHFAFPAYGVLYIDPDTNEVVDNIKVTGFTTYHALTNAFFDPDTLELTSFSKWRGLADASSSGVWTFIDGQFVLTYFDVDASYDGEHNPRRIFDKREIPLR